MSKENPTSTAEAYSYRFEELALQLRTAGKLNDKRMVNDVLTMIRNLTNSYDLDSMEIEIPGTVLPKVVKPSY